MLTTRTTLCGAFAAFAVFGATAAASAQSTALPDVGVSIRGGFFFPIDSNVRDLGSTWFGFGAQYRLLKLENATTPESHPSIDLSLDYYSRNGVSVTPILANYVIHQNSFFGSLGAGVAFNHGFGSSNTHFAFQAGVGYDLPVTGLPLFLEAKFWGNDESKVDGFGVYAGLRF